MREMRSVRIDVRKEVGSMVGEVRDQMQGMQANMDGISKEVERANSTASAAMESVLALRAEMRKEMDGLISAGSGK
eukprot:11116790-Karenia_brevis.AAC.1